MPSESTSSRKALPVDLLSLPPELRLEIYDHLWTPTISPREERPLISRFNIFIAGALLQTSRILRSEAQSIFYSRHDFLGSISSESPQPFIEWVQNIGPENVSLIPRIAITWTFTKPWISALEKYLKAVKDSERFVELEAHFSRKSDANHWGRMRGEEDVFRHAHEERRSRISDFHGILEQVDRDSMGAVADSFKELLRVAGIDGFRVKFLGPVQSVGDEYWERWSDSAELQGLLTRIRYKCQIALSQIWREEIENGVVGR